MEDLGLTELLDEKRILAAENQGALFAMRKFAAQRRVLGKQTAEEMVEAGARMFEINTMNALARARDAERMVGGGRREREEYIQMLAKRYHDAIARQDWDTAASVPRVPGVGQIPGDEAWLEWIRGVKPGKILWAVAKGKCPKSHDWRNDPVKMRKWREDVSASIKARLAACPRTYTNLIARRGPSDSRRGRTVYCREDGSEIRSSRLPTTQLITAR